MAGARGRKNTALLLTGGALYTWFSGGFKSAGRRNTALALTAASVVAWHKYNMAKRAERRRALVATIGVKDPCCMTGLDRRRARCAATMSRSEGRLRPVAERNANERGPSAHAAVQ